MHIFDKERDRVPNLELFSISSGFIIDDDQSPERQKEIDEVRRRYAELLKVGSVPVAIIDSLMELPDTPLTVSEHIARGEAKILQYLDGKSTEDIEDGRYFIGPIISYVHDDGDFVRLALFKASSFRLN